MAHVVFWLVNGLVVASIPVSFAIWSVVLYKAYRGGNFPPQLVPAEKRNRPFWTPADFLVMFGSMAILSTLLTSYARSRGWLPTVDPSAVPIISATTIITKACVLSLSGIGATLVTLTWLRLCNRNAISEIGISLKLSDFALGFKGALMILPPVFLIAGIASRLVPYEHEVLEDLAKLNDLTIFTCLFASTAIVTPVVEEIMFRVLIQGGVQGLIDNRLDDDGRWTPDSIWPLIGTSMLFAAMHLNQGAACIPLFFMALGVGYLYRQTGRITAPIVIHMILNSLTMVATFSDLQIGE